MSVNTYQAEYKHNIIRNETENTFVVKNTQKTVIYSELIADSGEYFPTKETDTFGNITTHSYDADARLISTRTQDGQVVSYTYNTDNLLSRIATINKQVNFEYDNSRLSKITLVSGTKSKNISFVYSSGTSEQDINNITQLLDSKNQVYVENTYDTNDRVISQKYGDKSLNYVYSLRNNENVESVNIINKRGIQSVQRYDENGNMIALEQSGKTYTYSYDSNNNLIKITKPKGNITQNSYDTKGNLVSQCQKTSESDAGICQHFLYDSQNNLIQNTDALGNVTSIEYNENNKVTKITQGNRGQSFEYNASGSFTTSIDAKNNATNYEYDSQANVTKITKADGKQITLSYDSNGNVFTMTDARGNTTTYAYTAFAQIKELTSPEGVKKQFVYDENNNLLQEKILGVKDFGGNNLTSDGNLVKNMRYGILDEILNITAQENTGSGRNIDFTYDANGNIEKIVKANGETISFEYNGFDKVSKRTTTSPQPSPTGEGGERIEEIFSYDDNQNLVIYTNSK